MSQFWDFLQTLLAQFAGGPGPTENNLVRFGLAALFWAVLLYVAWSRQRTQDLPREKLLLWGFGLGMMRELFMFGETAMRIIMVTGAEFRHTFHEPIEHALAMAAIVVVAGAFLRYLLDDPLMAKRYLQIGLGFTFLFLVIALWTWPARIAVNPDLRFHQSWEAWLFHLPLPILILAAVVIMERERGWLRNVVTLALLLFTISEVLILVNFATDRAYNFAICPLANSLHILAIPLLGYVYLREQSLEKSRVEADLAAYRDHLEELVEERTSALSTVNIQLTQEIRERKRAEAEIEQRNMRLAAQNMVAATLSQSMDLPTILNATLETLLSVLKMDEGLVFLEDADEAGLRLTTYRGPASGSRPLDSIQNHCICARLARQAMEQKEAAVISIEQRDGRLPAACMMQKRLCTLVSAPLICKGQAIGAMTMGAERIDALHQSELDLLTTIGQQIGLAVDNVRHYQDAERWAEELALLHEASLGLTATLDPERIYMEIVQQSPLLLDCEMAIVLLWTAVNDPAQVVASFGLENREIALLRAHSAAPDLWQDLQAGQRPIAIADTRADRRVPTGWRDKIGMRTLACLPLWSSKSPFEVLLLCDRHGPRHWRPREMELLENFVNRAALALANADLHQQLEWMAALEERQRIAADMHDGVAQMLSLLGLKVDLVHDLLHKEAAEKAAIELAAMREILERATAEVRHSIASLQEAPPPRHTIQDLLKDLINQFEWNGKTEVDLISRVADPLFLPPDQQEQVLPVVQEALQNARRHARARTITVTLERDADNITLIVADDGRGFDPGAAPAESSNHFGLSIMEARAARMGGRLQVAAGPGQGTCVSLTWPLAAEGAGGLPFSSRAPQQQRPFILESA